MSSRGAQTAAVAVVAVPLLLAQPPGSEVAAAGVTTHHVKKQRAKKYRVHKRRHYRPTKVACVMLSPEDRDLITRTVMGEASGEPYSGKVAVAAVIRNRLLDGGYGGDTWSTRRRELLSYSPDDPRYQEAAEAVDEAFAGNDPTGGATHFANVGTVADRGNQTALGWLRSMSNVSKIGRHTFGNADGKGDGRVEREIDTDGGGSVLGRMSGLDDNSDIDRLMQLGEDDPYDLTSALTDETDDPRRLAVRSLITEILDGLQPSAGQGHAVAPEDGAADEDAEA